MACRLFNTVPQKVIKDSRVQTSGHIFIKPIQLVASAGDVVIARTRSDLMEGFYCLEGAARRTGLEMEHSICV